ncbi:MAG: 2Fe-2S iron-sulfur cluster binding domain-containing protein [Nostoc sp. TH1S01]|nr:2Fe-2S iron-sulfur cluster binding domain-containing protein [Nostoc sp. TH1S01]
MLESLGRINHPFVRSLAAAATVGSVVTLSTAIIIGFANPKDKSANQFGVYSSLFGAAAGAVLGLVYTGKDSADKSILDITTSDSNVWQDWRNFVVVRKVKESEEITSFYLQPEDKGEIPNFQPGQFLTIKLDIPGQNKPVIRTYSLSDYPETGEYYRLSIKREPAPNGLDVMPGIASNFMHDRIHEGAVIPAKPPNGKFVLDVHKSTPAVLISNGVGITPMMSMAKACTRLNPQRPVWFIHGARDGQFHAFQDEIMEIAQQNSNLNIHIRYSRPRPEDAGKYHSVGYVDTALVQELCQQDAEYFLCGSTPFIQSVTEGLKAAGIPNNQVFFESFGNPIKTESPKSTQTTTQSEEFAEIVFAKSGKTLTWQPSDGTILEFAEANDINPPFSCRIGVCGTCMCKLREGEVVYQEEPGATPDECSVLICISQPGSSKLVLDI